MQQGTIGELFEISIATEGEARVLYRTLADKFQALPEAYKFFNSMVDDESEHIEPLSTVFESLSPEELDREAPIKAITIAKRFLNFSVKSILENITTLGDACDATINLEFSEANKLHELLVELHADDQQKRELYECLQSHLDKATNFKRSGVDLGYMP